MKFFPREKHRIDFVGLATRPEKNRWLARLYVVIGILFFGYVFYSLAFGA